MLIKLLLINIFWVGIHLNSTTQRLIAGDMPQRLNFCGWYIEHVSLFKNLFLFFCCNVSDVVFIYLLIIITLIYSVYADEFQ